MKRTSPTQQNMNISERLTSYQRGQRGQREQRWNAGTSPNGTEEEPTADEVQQGVASRRIRILRKRHAMEKTGLSESTFDDLRRADPTFPEAIALGARAVGFVEGELDDWLARQPRIRVCRVTADSEPEV
jgi:prophage regulatory protein